MAWASRYDDGGQSVIHSNRSFISSLFHSLLLLYPRKAILPTLVGGATDVITIGMSRCDKTLRLIASGQQYS